MTDLVALAYSAGLIDGEGTVTYSHQRAGARRVPVVSVASTTLELVEYLRTTWGGSVSVHKTYQAHHKESWVWMLRYNQALDFLERILPYMREPEKIRRSTLLVQQHRACTPRNGRYTEDMLAAKDRLEAEFFA